MEKIKLYNGTIELAFEPNRHLYTANGEIVYGVTGILGVINKPALIPWAVNTVITNLTDALKPGQSYDEIELSKMLNEAKNIYAKKRDDAGDVGTMIHAWIEKWINGENPDKPVNEMMAIAVDSFLKWVAENKVEFIHSERKIYSKQYKYAGTLDFLAKMDDKYFVGDIKTSSGIYPEMFFQTAAYQNAYTEEFPEIGIDRNVIIRCGKDGSFEIGESKEHEKNFDAFLGALKLYNRLQEIKDNNK